MLTLLEFARQYTAIRPVSSSYAATLHARAKALQKFHRRDDITEALTEKSVNAFLQSLHGSSWTINKYRQDLLAIWRAAADQNLVPYPMARRIRRLPQAELVVECYSTDEARQLLRTAAKLTGTLCNGVHHNRYWPAAIRAAWDSGLRRGDIWEVETKFIRPNGVFRKSQNKTRRLVVCQFRESTVKAIEHAGGSLAWPHDEKTFSDQFAFLVKTSGVKRGSFKWLRRASGSYVEMEQPGAGHKHLGHATPQIFNRHYDARLGGHTLPQPPEL
jgi:hypothetical protein